MFHPFHLVTLSPWPLLVSFNLLYMAVSLISSMTNTYTFSFNLKYSLLLLLVSISLWIRDILRESNYLGFHNTKVMKGIKLGFFLFILSEVMVFFSFIWSYLFLSLNPGIEIACVWPPYGIISFNPYTFPLFNTILLLSSGATITWCHYGLYASSRKDIILGLLFTIVLGLIFTSCQMFEYFTASFSINSSIWGSTFYLTTGLHGLHVILGSLFLIFSLYRLFNYELNYVSHNSLETGILYWHFVDLVWLFVYSLFYLWI